MVFYNGTNTSTETKLVVCVDKDWGTSGCGIMSDGSVMGDWIHDGLSTPNSSAESPYFYPESKLTIEVTDPCNDYKVEVRDENNNVLLSTQYEQVCSPVPFFVPTPTPTSTPTSTPTPTPTPTLTPTPTATPTPIPCPPLIRTGNSILDKVLFCVHGYGVTVLVAGVAFFMLLILRGR